jgi:hypothetical protein
LFVLTLTEFGWRRIETKRVRQARVRLCRNKESARIDGIDGQVSLIHGKDQALEERSEVLRLNVDW